MPSAYRCSTTLGEAAGRLGQPVLQVGPGPANLAAHQVGGRPAQVCPGPPPADSARKAAADRPGQQLRLARILARGKEEGPVLGQPPARLGHGQVQVQQLSRGAAQHIKFGLQVASEPRVHPGQPLFDLLPALVPPGADRIQNQRGQLSVSLSLDIRCRRAPQVAAEQFIKLPADVIAQPTHRLIRGVVERKQQPP